MLIAGASGCTTPQRQTEGARQAWISFVHDGQTTRDQVVSRFGPPTDVLDEGSVVVYRLLFWNAGGAREIRSALTGSDAARFEGVEPVVAHGDNPVDEQDQANRGLEWSFVIVLDERGIVRQHSFIRVRSPFTYR